MRGRRAWVEVPEGWERVRSAGPWPFTTSERYRLPDGREARWQSRADRTHPVDASTERTWWAPHALGWWIGVLFALGSTCFLAGSFPPYADVVGERRADITFFVGSIFFTSAAWLQYRQAAGAARTARLGFAPVAGAVRRWRPLTWAPARIDWWATSVQLVGTLLFNVSTFAAVRQGLDATEEVRRVWAPDAWGSVCFLVASLLAFAEAGHAWLSWRPRSLPWWIAASNLFGSVAFGVSAIGAYVVTSTDTLLNEAAANGGTFLGAVGFLVGAVLLLPERTLSHAEAMVEPPPPTSPATPPAGVAAG